MGVKAPEKPLARLLRRRRGSRTPEWAPEPPVELPPGRVVRVPGRGEMFVRDTGGDGPAVLLLHGWLASADMNWFTTFEALRAAGYRVLATDHRGHGRGLRPDAPFRLADCAADAAALLEALEVEPALVVGYSMGGPIASLLTREHRERVAGIVLCATAPDWSLPRMKLLWRGMGVMRLLVSVFPRGFWRAGLRAAGFPPSPATTWIVSELTRGSAVDTAEAGRELGRYDGRSWLPSLAVPAAVIVTTQDAAVPPHKQRELAALLSAPAFEVHGDHAAVTVNADSFNDALLRALASVGERAAGGTAVASAAA